MPAADASAPRATRWAGPLLAAAGIVYLAAEAVAAAGFAGYSYATNYISDLGIAQPGSFDGRTVDSTLAPVMNIGFLLEGLLLFLGSLLATRVVQNRGQRVALTTLAAMHWVGISLVGLVQGSQENVDRGLGIVHVTGAALAIIGGNLLFVLAGRVLRPAVGVRVGRALMVLGVLGLLSLVMLQLADGLDQVLLFPEGAWERGSVYSITASEIVAGVALLVESRHGGASAARGGSPSRESRRKVS